MVQRYVGNRIPKRAERHDMMCYDMILSMRIKLCINKYDQVHYIGNRVLKRAEIYEMVYGMGWCGMVSHGIHTVSYGIISVSYTHLTLPTILLV